MRECFDDPLLCMCVVPQLLAFVPNTLKFATKSWQIWVVSENQGCLRLVAVERKCYDDPPLCVRSSNCLHSSSMFRFLQHRVDKCGGCIQGWPSTLCTLPQLPAVCICPQYIELGPTQPNLQRVFSCKSILSKLKAVCIRYIELGATRPTGSTRGVSAAKKGKNIADMFVCYQIFVLTCLFVIKYLRCEANLLNKFDSQFMT